MTTDAFSGPVAHSGSGSEGFTQPTADNAASADSARRQAVWWSDAEWLVILKTLMVEFPELGLPNPGAVSRVQMRHMLRAMEALPGTRRRHLAHVIDVRKKLAKFCGAAQDAPQQKRKPRPPDALGPKPAPVPVPQQVAFKPATLAVPASVVYRQPDGAEVGTHKGKIFWTAEEWYALAVELAYRKPGYLETLSDLSPAELNRAQRVLPSNRRRPYHSLIGERPRTELAPAFRRLRAAVEAARNEQAAAESRKAAEAAAAQAAEEQAARQAARQAAIADAMASGEILTAALARAVPVQLIDALASRFAASAQAVIEAALLNVLSSAAAKNALVVHVHMDRPDDIRPTAKAPSATSEAGSAAVIVKRKVGIVGALAQQGETLKAAFPGLHIKIIDKNLEGQALRAAITNCDRVIAMTDFISHSIDGVGAKAAGENYYRCTGGVSSVRHLIGAWLSAGFGA